MPKTICLDFNGVLDQYTGWKGKDYMYPPREGVGEFLYSLMTKGYRIVILSAIEPARIWEWLQKYEIDGLIDDVTNIKPPASVYVDDRAICFRGDFTQTLEEIDQFKPFWENKP